MKVTLVRSPEGKIVELAAKAGLAAAMKERGHTWFERRGGRSSSGASAAEKRAREVGKIKTAIAREVLATIADKGTAKVQSCDLDPDAVWRALARAAVRSAWHDSARDVAARRGLKKTGKGWRPEEVLMKGIEEAAPSACFGLVLELLAHRDVNYATEQRRVAGGTTTGDFCELLGIDRAAIAKRVTAEAKEMATKRESGKKAKAAKATKKKVLRKGAATGKPEAPAAGVCRVCGCTDDDCSQCFEKTGEPCTWVEPDLCSACAPAKKPERTVDRPAGKKAPGKASRKRVAA